jgi:hypothetical protein
MICNEKFLRQMIASRHGDVVCASIMEQIDEGHTVTIHFAEAGQVVLADKQAAMHVLVDKLGWQPTPASTAPPVS